MSTYVAKAENVGLLGPGIGKTHLAIGLGVKATQAGYSATTKDPSGPWTRRRDATVAPRPCPQTGNLDQKHRSPIKRGDPRQLRERSRLGGPSFEVSRGKAGGLGGRSRRRR